MAANDKAEDKKSMDGVSKPGKSTPDTSSRPVVISHRPMVQDPTLKQTETTEQKQTSTRSDKIIKPIDVETTDKSEDTTAKSVDESTKTETKPEPPSKKEDSKPETESSSSDEAVVEAVVDQATADKKKQNELSDAEKAKQELVTKLTTDKKYFVPIGQVAKRRNRRTSIVLVVLLLIVVGAYLAADAGVIKAPFTLPIDLIKT